MDIIEATRNAGISELNLIFFDGLAVGPSLRNTLLVDKVNTREESLLEIYKRLRPGEPPTIEAAEGFFQRLFLILKHMI